MSTARGARDPRSRRTPGVRQQTRGSARRPATRPASRATSRPGGRRTTRSHVGAGRSTQLNVRRLVALGILLVVMALVLAPAVNGYLGQRADIAAAREQIEAEREEILALEQELSKWEDDDYVEQQARERLRFVKEGETAFTVIDDTGTDYTEALPGMAPVSDDVIAESPWYGQVWESVKVANEGLPETTEP